MDVEQVKKELMGLLEQMVLYAESGNVEQVAKLDAQFERVVTGHYRHTVARDLYAYDAVRQACVLGVNEWLAMRQDFVKFAKEHYQLLCQ